MNWFIWIIISVVSIAISNILQRLLMKDEKSDPVAYTVIFLVFLTIMTGLFAVFKGFVFPPFSEYWFNFFLSAVLYALGTVIWFKALQKIGSSEAIIISTFGVVATIGSAMIFLGENISYRQVFGTVLIFSSIYILNKIKGKFIFTNYHFLALFSSICYGLAATNDLYIISKGYDSISYVSVMSILPAIVLVVMKPAVIKHISNYLTVPFVKNMLIMTLFYAIQAISYYIAYDRGGSASQISSIYKSSIILTVILAAVFLREKENIARKFMSAVLVTIGILLIK